MVGESSTIRIVGIVPVTGVFTKWLEGARGCALETDEASRAYRRRWRDHAVA
jgi:hypothetical protein